MTLALQPINLDLGELMANTCSVKTLAMDKFQAHMLLPIILLIIICLAMVIARLFTKTKAGKHEQSALAIKLVASLLLILYPGLCQRVFSIFNCRSIIGVPLPVLATDYNVTCYEDVHSSMVLLAYGCMALWVIGIPLFFFISLRCNKKHLHDEWSTNDGQKHEEVVKQFGTLYLQYEPKYWYWEILVIFYKMLLTGAISVFEPGTTLQIVAAIAIVVANMLFTLKVAPFADQTDDWLAFLTSLQLFVTLFGGMLLSTTNSEWNEGGMGTFLVVINSFGFICMLLSIIAMHPRIRKCINGKSDDGGGGGETKVYPAGLKGENDKNVELQNRATKAWDQDAQDVSRD